MRKTWITDRWFLLAVVALHVNVCGWLWVAYHAAGSEERANRLPEFSLGGKDGYVRGLSTLRWTFPAPVVPRGRTGYWVTNTVVDLDPRIEGAVRWATPDVLEFKPLADWPKCQVYQARLIDRLSERAGRRVAVATAADEFTSEPLQVLEVTASPGAGDYGRLQIRLRFNAAPDEKSLLRNLRIETPEGRRVEWTAVAGTGTDELRLETGSYLDRDIDFVKMVLEQGLASSAGPVGLPEELVYQVPRKAPFAFAGVEVSTPDGWSQSSASVTLRFTRLPMAKDFMDYVRVEPAIDDLEAGFSGWGDSVSLRGRFMSGVTYRVQVLAGLACRTGERLEKGADRMVMIPDRAPALRFRDEGRYLSREGARKLAVEAVNVPRLLVTARPVFANNLVYGLRRETSRSWWWDDEDAFDGLLGALQALEVSLAAPGNEVRAHSIDLRELLPEDASGVWMVKIEDARPTSPENDFRAPLQDTKVVVFSDTGLLAKKSANEIVVWADSLQTLAAVSNAAIQVLSSANQVLGEGTTDAQGLARIPLREADGYDETPFLVVSRCGPELSILNLANTRLDFTDATAGEDYHREGYEAFLYTDRGIYRPGETVHVKAVVRDAAFAPSEPFPLEFVILRPDGGKLAPQTAMLSELGTAEISVAMSPELPSGTYTVEAWVPGSAEAIGSRTYSSEDFIPPQIALEASCPVESVETGDVVPVVVKARHLFGGAGANLAAEARMSVKAVKFSHPDWRDYTFGNAERSFSTVFGESNKEVTDDNGLAEFLLPTEASWAPASRLQGVICVTVRETSGRASSQTKTVWIDPYPWYIGLRSPVAGGPWPVGAPAKVDVIAVTPDGVPAAEAEELTYELFHVTWSTVFTRDRDGIARYESQRSETEVASGEVTPFDGRADLPLTVNSQGLYRLVVNDGSGGASSAMEFYASDSADSRNAWSMEKPGRVELKPDRESYLPGATAVVRAEAPHGGKALITVETDRVIYQAVQMLEGNTAEVCVPVTVEMWPNAYVTVQILRPVKAGEVPGLHRAAGVARLNVDRPERRLAVTVTAPAEMRPQSRLSTSVQVTGAAGQPCEVSLAAVEEGICLLTNLKTPDPLGWFARLRRLGTEHLDLYSLLLPELDESLQAALSDAGGDGIGQLERRLNPIKTRRYKPTVLWVGNARTDSNGLARIDLDVPEYTGALRLMAVAVAPGAVGSADTTVKVKRPLILQAGVPRFLAPGDEAEGNLWIANQSATPVPVTWRVQAEGPLSLPFSTGTVIVEAEGDVTVPLPLRAAGDQAGAVRLHIEIAGGGESASEDIELPVRPAVARETVLRSGRVEPGQTIALASTARWLPSTAGGVLQAGGLPALRWKGAYEALLRYPYGCLEQTLSTSFPLVYAAELFEDMLPGRLTREDAAGYVQAGIARVLSMQRPGGAFGWWPGAQDDYAYGSVYAVEFLTEARRAQFDVPDDSLDRALDWVERMLDAGRERREDRGTPAWHQVMREQAFACSQLARNARAREDWQARLWELRSELDAPARLQLARAWAATGAKDRALELLSVAATPGSAPTGDTVFDRTLQSPSAQIALHLRAWLETEPGSASIPALAERLIAMQAGGHWPTTHDNAQALLALGAYARVAAAQRKPFQAVLSLARKPDMPFDADKPLKVDWQTWQGAAASLVNRGPGVLYYHVCEDGIPLRAAEPEGDHDLSVRRSFVSLRNVPLDPGNMQVGDFVVLCTELDTQGVAREQIVIESLLPAGLEVENPALATSAETPWIDTDSALPVLHQEMRDDRIVLFTGAVNGVRVHHALARAVTPGIFALPAISAEAMYDPAVRSRSGAGICRISAGDAPTDVAEALP